MKQTLCLLSLDQWQQTVEACPDSTTFHHRNWLELLGRQYGFPLRILAITQQQRVLAAIPFLQTRGLLGGRSLVSLPFSDCVPLLPAPADAVETLCSMIRADKSENYDAVIVRSDTPLAQATCASHQVRHLLPTDRPWKSVEAGFDKSILRNLRRAEESGLRFDWRTDEEAMDVFYCLHLATRRKLGVPVQPRRYFRQFHQAIVRPGLASLGVVSRRGRPLAAAVFLTYKRSLIYKYSASDSQALEFRPNDVLILHGIRRAVEEGRCSFDFGSSEKDQVGLRRFKRKWGAAERDIQHAYLVGAPHDGLRQSLPFKVSSFAIRHSPTIVCRCLGEALYRFSQ